MDRKVFIMFLLVINVIYYNFNLITAFIEFNYISAQRRQNHYMLDYHVHEVPILCIRAVHLLVHNAKRG